MGNRASFMDGKQDTPYTQLPEHAVPIAQAAPSAQYPAQYPQAPSAQPQQPYPGQQQPYPVPPQQAYAPAQQVVVVQSIDSSQEQTAKILFIIGIFVALVGWVNMCMHCGNPNPLVKRWANRSAIVAAIQLT